MMQLRIYLFITFILISCYKCTRQVTLTCGGDEDESSDAARITASPGKRGPAGLPGIRGLKGAKGEQGENDGWIEAFQKLQKEISEYKRNISAQLDQNIQQIQGLRRKNCKHVQGEGVTSSDWYTISTNSKIVDVYCDMETDGGGWLVFQSRSSGNVDFYRGWSDYKSGFGIRSEEWWLGLEIIHQIISAGSYELRVDLEDAQSNRAFAKYSEFSIGSESSNYVLHVGGYSGNASDSIEYHNNRQFTTHDQDHDGYSSGNCAEEHHGAWWYHICHISNLNGEYLTPGTNNARGIDWRLWKNRHYSMKSTEMKIRPN